jgi:hypothetical protein
MVGASTLKNGEGYCEVQIYKTTQRCAPEGGNFKISTKVKGNTIIEQCKLM